MDTPTRLFLIRHAEVAEPYHRVFGGRIDMDLSAEGERQASALGRYLASRLFDAVYASPMKRVQQTLARWDRVRSCPDTVVNGFREVDFGDWTGLSWDQVQEKFQTGAHRWLDELDRGLIPGAESAAGFRERVATPLQEVLKKHTGQQVVVACHGGVIRMMLSILLDIPLPKMARFEFDYASVTVVQVLPHKTEVHLANFTPWRDPL